MRLSYNNRIRLNILIFKFKSLFIKMDKNVCSKCGSKYLYKLRSHQCKLCSECGTAIPWELNPDKDKPLIKHQR